MAFTVSRPAIGTCCCEPMTTKQLTEPQEASAGRAMKDNNHPEATRLMMNRLT
jgi:hypothetical protein